MKFKTAKVVTEATKDCENGKAIRDLRIKKGKSLRWLASKLSISAPYLSDMELGRRGFSEAWFQAALKNLK